MDAVDDEDIRLQRASAGLLSDLRSSLEKILWKPTPGSQGQRRVHRLVRQQDLYRLLSFVGEYVVLMRLSLLTRLQDRAIPGGASASRHAVEACCSAIGLSFSGIFAPIIDHWR